MTPRYTEDSYQPLTIDGKEYLIPPHTHVLLNITHLHTLPLYWGAEPFEFRPERWFDERGDFIQQPPGVFNPWIAGPRVCPGKKFAQVEFVAALAGLFYGAEVRVKVGAGETEEEACGRLMAVAEDTVLDVTNHMLYPERAMLVWETNV